MNKTQALRLSKMVQQHSKHKSYVLALPLMEVEKSKLEKLSEGDVFLLGLDALELILIDAETTYATAVLKKEKSKEYFEIVQLREEKISEIKRKKSVKLHFSCGEVKIETLNLGHTIEMTQIDLDTIHLVSDEKNIASATLICVDDEIAVEITKVTI